MNSAARSPVLCSAWFPAVCLSMSLVACGNGSSSVQATGGSVGASSGGSAAVAGAAPGGNAGLASSLGGSAESGAAAGTLPGGASAGGSSGDAALGGSGGGAAASGGVTSGAAGAGTGGASGGASSSAGASGAAPDMFPLSSVLPLFSAPDVPLRGPMESPPSAKGWTPPAMAPVRTGMGIAQHPMLYVGENYNRITLVNGGKVVWTYDTTPGFELDDVWMLSNGNILYSHMTFIEEITPKKQVVWHYVPTTGEIHTLQPIGLDKVLFVENALPMARVRLFNLKTGMFEVDHMIDAGTDQHGEFRRFRMTGAGTYLASFLGLGKVVEYDKNFNVLWTFVTPRPWSSVRLKNGNTLILDESQQNCIELNPAQQVVWQMKSADVPVPAGVGFGASQTCERLSTGNTVLFGHSSSTSNAQAVEVTAAKQVVWILQDWVNLGDATSAQFLDEPGYPEVPGDTNH